MIDLTITLDGNLIYSKDGLFHREDGPAVIHANGTKEWYINGNRHREDGPAVIHAIGTKEWWVNGIQYHLIKDYKPHCTVSDEELFMLILKYGGLR